MTKAQAIQRAQQAANNSHRTMLVALDRQFHLNPYAPLYVVRDWSQQARDSNDFVAEIEPQA